MFGFGGVKESTQILFAIGKAGTNRDPISLVDNKNRRGENALFR